MKDRLLVLVMLSASSVKDALATGDRVTISGFGELKEVYKKSRIGRNPEVMRF
jgi:nucleoid DNA-binding protein